MLKVVLGIAIGFVLFTNQGARQITADALRAAADALAPEKEGKVFQGNMKNTDGDKVLEQQ